MSFQDKLKPIATSTPSFESKLKPMGQSAPSPAPTSPAPTQQPSFFDKFKSDILTPVAGAAYGFTKSGRTIQNLASKGVDKLFGTEGFGKAGGAKEYADALGLDSESKQFKTSAFVGEAGSYMMPGGQASALTKGSGIGAKMLVAGATDGAMQALNDGEVSKKTLATALTSAATTGVFGLAGKLLAKSGEAIQNAVIKPSQADIADGFSMETIKKYDLGGSLQTTHDKTEALMSNITKELNEKLASSNATINLDEVYEATVKRLTKDNMKTFGSNSGVGNALNSLKGEIDIVGKNTSIPEAQIIKRSAGQYGAWTFGRPNADAASEAVYNIFYNELKNTIENNSPAGVRELNKQLSELIPVQNAVIKRIPVEARNNVLSLTDIIGLTAASVDPSALGVVAITRGQKSGAFGNLLNKAGTGLSNRSVPAGIGAGFITDKLIGTPNNQTLSDPAQLER